MRATFLTITCLYAIHLYLTVTSGKRIEFYSYSHLVLWCSILAAFAFGINAWKALHHQPQRFPINLIFPSILAFTLLSSIYYQKNTYVGGDVDPVAFLEQDTVAYGGYFLLTDRTTYRERIISKDDFFEHPFSTYKLLDGVPSITTIHEYPIGFPLNVPGRSFRVTMSLSDGIIHFPFDKSDVRNFLADYGSTEGFMINPDHLIASALAKIADPVLRSLTYAPANGSFAIELNTTKGILGDLEKYGFRIAHLPTATPKLVIRIQARDESKDGWIFQEASYKASDIPKTFPKAN